MTNYCRGYLKIGKCVTQVKLFAETQNSFQMRCYEKGLVIISSSNWFVCVPYDKSYCTKYLLSLSLIFKQILFGKMHSMFIEGYNNNNLMIYQRKITRFVSVFTYVYASIRYRHHIYSQLIDYGVYCQKQIVVDLNGILEKDSFVVFREGRCII